MDTPVLAERSSLEEATYSFVQDLAVALNGRTAIEIPSFPSIAMRVKGILEDENSTAQTIARVVGSEPGLASRLLTMANSAALNTSGQQILDIKSAINRLGHDQIRSSAMSFAMKNLMDARTVAQLKDYLTQLWNHSVQVAAIAFSLAKRTAGVNPDEAMFVGLVHDIGKLYILTRIEGYPEIYESSDTTNHILDDWHSPIGKTIVENWGFPEQIQEAIEQHEDHERNLYGDPDLTDVIIVANLFANLMSDGNLTPEPEEFERVSSCVRMGITAQAFPVIMQESQNEINELENALKG